MNWAYWLALIFGTFSAFFTFLGSTLNQEGSIWKISGEILNSSVSTGIGSGNNDPVSQLTVFVRLVNSGNSSVHILDSSSDMSVVSNGKTHHLEKILLTDGNSESLKLPTNREKGEFLEIPNHQRFLLRDAIEPGTLAYGILRFRGHRELHSQKISEFHLTLIDALDHKYEIVTKSEEMEGIGALINNFDLILPDDFINTAPPA